MSEGFAFRQPDRHRIFLSCRAADRANERQRAGVESLRVSIGLGGNVLLPSIPCVACVACRCEERVGDVFADRYVEVPKVSHSGINSRVLGNKIFENPGPAPRSPMPLRAGLASRLCGG